jgi:FAD/FMN-containing dehydrogenase
LRYGPIRDKLLGLRALLAADNSSKSGGRLVKNVAGYDLHRAHCGGRGSFGLILEATVRLHPALPVELHLHRPVDGLQDGHALATRILASAARPLAVRLVEERDQTTLRVHLGGREDVVQHEQHLLRAICGELVEGPPHVNRSPLLRVDSMRSRALAASLWAGETRAGLELDTTLIADPGIAMTQLVPLQETTHRLALGALSALPERTHLVIPAAGSAVAAPVARLGEAVARALDPAEIFARANF